MSRFNYSSSSFDKDDGDISEADPNEIAKMLRETDDLDGDLFRDISKSNFSKTMPARNNSKPMSSQKNKSFNLDDDPLGDFDFDAMIGKSSFKPSAAKAQNNNSLSKTMNAPVKASNPTNRQESSYNPAFNQTAPSPSKRGALVEDLFGSKSSADVPVKQSGSMDDMSEFKLNDKYLNMSSQSNKVDDEAGFGGGYQPSAMSSRSTGGMKRNVSFTDELFGPGGTDNIFNSLTRPKTATVASDKQEEPQSNLMRTMPNPATKKADDWLTGLIPGNGSSSNNAANASSNNNHNQSRRKSNDFNLDELIKPRDSSSNRGNTSGSKNANSGSDLDWLGFKDSSRDSIDANTTGRHQQRDNPVLEKPPMHSTNPNNQVPKTSNIAKDSMNSSFADSVELHDNNRAQPQTKSENMASESKVNELHGPSSVNGEEDGWLNSLMSKKGGVKKTSNDIEIKSNENSGNNRPNNTFSDMTTSNPNLLAGTSTLDKSKSSYFMRERTSSPNHLANSDNNLDKIKSISMMTNLNYDSGNMDNQAIYQKIKQLDYENQDLKMQLQHNKAHYELQLQLSKESCDNQIRMIKEDRENGLRLFKEEKEILQNHIDYVEKEKLEMSNVYKRKLEDTQKECDMEIEKLRQIQRDAVRVLKEDHEDAIKRVKQMKESELEAAMSATAHSRTIESVLTLIEDNTKNLDGLSQKVHMGHMVNLSEHDVQIRNKEENLKIQEERLARKQKDYENEIKNLNAIIQRLENHLAEQSKMVAEERWKSKQQEKKLEALQDALINEQRISMEKIARDRNDVERSKDDILTEQKRLMQQIYEEKRRIAEEKAQVEAAIAGYKDRQHKDSLSNINIEAEISVSTRRLNEEKSRLEELGRELKEKEFMLKQEKIKLEESRMEIERKTAKLEQMAATVNHKYIQAEDLSTRAARDKESQVALFKQENQIKESHETRLHQIQQQLMMVNEREAQINQEKLAVYKERQELEMFKSNIMCSKCKEPVKDFGMMGLQTGTTGYGSYIHNTQSIGSTMLNSMKHNSPLNKYMTSTANDLEQSKLLRQLKIQSMRDKQYINEEKTFIDSLTRSNSGFMNRSLSMNQLNSTLA